MPYIPPDQVTAPNGMWELRRVLVAGSTNEPAYALGKWDGNPCIGTRWNGTDNRPLGFPNIFGAPCWHILDSMLHDAVIALLPNYRDKLYAMRFLAGEEL